MNLNQMDSVLLQFRSMGFGDSFAEILVTGRFAASTNQENPMNTLHRYSAIAAIAFAAAGMQSTTAFAADSGDALIQHVNFTDLDLSREAGARTLYQRIKSAADRVCAPLSGRQLIEHMNRSACVASAVERAVRHVNEPTLTRYYLARNPKSDLATSLAARR